MDMKARIRLKGWILIIGVWILFLNLFTWMVQVSADIFSNFINLENLRRENAYLDYTFSGYQYLESTLFGLFFGFIFALTNHYIDRTRIRRKSFGKVILLRSGMYIGGLVVTFFLIFGILVGFSILPEGVTFEVGLDYLSFDTVMLAVVYFGGTIVLLNFFHQVSQKFGPGNLWKMIIGTYSQPRNEERIFMFLDMKNSTGLAESLGHDKYSRLLRSCYYDLTDIVLKYRADIYQYVGDEVVLTWKSRKGLKNLNCIKAYFAYERKLEKGKERYLEEFGVEPVFKAGLDIGVVTATEIGEIKREIAFHGDVLNTAARIQEKCNSVKARMLISERLKEQLNLTNGFSVEETGVMELRGKSESMGVYKVDYSDEGDNGKSR